MSLSFLSPFSVPFCVLPASSVVSLWGFVLERKSQEKGQGGRSCSAFGVTSRREGSLSYTWVSMVGHSLYLVKKGYKRRGICCTSSVYQWALTGYSLQFQETPPTQAWKGYSLQPVVGPSRGLLPRPCSALGSASCLNCFWIMVKACQALLLGHFPITTVFFLTDWLSWGKPLPFSCRLARYTLLALITLILVR